MLEHIFSVMKVATGEMHKYSSITTTDNYKVTGTPNSQH